VLPTAAALPAPRPRRSLLAYHRGSGTLRHYDSAGGCNRLPARRLAPMALAVVGQPAAGARAGAGLVEVAGAPQQRNSHDCGLYLLAVAGRLSAWLAGGQLASPGALARRERELAAAVTPAAAGELRARVLAVVEAKMAAAAAAP
jgi:hypothetical protein